MVARYASISSHKVYETPLARTNLPVYQQVSLHKDVHAVLYGTLFGPVYLKL